MTPMNDFIVGNDAAIKKVLSFLHFFFFFFFFFCLTFFPVF